MVNCHVSPPFGQHVFSNNLTSKSKYKRILRWVSSPPVWRSKVNWSDFFHGKVSRIAFLWELFRGNVFPWGLAGGFASQLFGVGWWWSLLLYTPAKLKWQWENHMLLFVGDTSSNGWFSIVILILKRCMCTGVHAGSILTTMLGDERSVFS